MVAPYAAGLLGSDRLDEAELTAAMHAMGVRQLTDRIGGVFVNLLLRDDGLDIVEIENTRTLGLRRLFLNGGLVPRSVVKACALGVLVPGRSHVPHGRVDFERAARVNGVEGWTFRCLPCALNEIIAYGDATGERAPGLVQSLETALSLGVGVMVGSRQRFVVA